MAGIAYVTRNSVAEQSRSWLEALTPWSRGRTLPPLERSALLVVDVQRYFTDPSSHAFLPALTAVLPGIGELQNAFERAGRLVLFTRHGARHDSPPSLMRGFFGDELRLEEPRAALDAELGAPSAEQVIAKQHYSAFVGTDLAERLRAAGCDTLVIVGAMTHLCCETTARDAFMRGFVPVVVADATATSDEELHLGALRGLAHGVAVVSPATDVCRAIGASPPASSAADAPAAQPLPREIPLAIVGAGPAGIAAAVQAQRLEVPLWLISSGAPGGQLESADWVENYPGFPGGIAGRQLARRFAAQAREHGVPLLRAQVSTVERRADGRFAVQLTVAPNQLATLVARAVIVATGTAPRPHPLLEGGVAHAHLDSGAIVPESSRVVIVGGGEAAFDQALAAARQRAASITVLIRGARPRAMARLVERARSHGVQIFSETTVEDVALRPDAPRLRLRLGGAGAGQSIAADVLVVCTGKRPLLPDITPALTTLPSGALAADPVGRTSLEGLYLAGDVRRGSLRQTGIAVGDGLSAAIDAAEWLDQRSDRNVGEWDATDPSRDSWHREAGPSFRAPVR